MHPALCPSQLSYVIASHYDTEEKEDEGDGKETQHSYQVAEESEE